MPEEKTAKIRQQDPLHDITLKNIVIQLEGKLGWEELGQRIKIKCFTHNPSINSSLNFYVKHLGPEKRLELFILKL